MFCRNGLVGFWEMATPAVTAPAPAANAREQATAEAEKGRKREETLELGDLED